MPVESAGDISLWKTVGIVFGPLLAILAAAFGFMWKRQDSHMTETEKAVSDLKIELYKDYVTQDYLEMYVALVVKPVVESVDKLAESNRELAREIREERNRR